MKSRRWRHAMLIRERPAELHEEAVDLWHRTELTRPWDDPRADLQRAVRGAASTVLAACDDQGSPIGTSMVGHDGHRGWVYYLAVAPEQQRHGVGHALMRGSEKWLAERGVAKVNLMVSKGNEGVLTFSNALGDETARSSSSGALSTASCCPPRALPGASLRP